MKVKNIILSADDGEYLNFWKLNSEICFKKLGLQPVLFHITNDESDFVSDSFGLVKKVKTIPGVSSAYMAQVIRMYATRYFPDEVCLTSDIDMFLFNRDYVHESVKHIPDDDLVIYTSDGYDDRPECVGEHSKGRYPICYVAATGRTFNKVLDTDCSFEEYAARLYPFTGNTDELHFSKMVDGPDHNVKVHKLKRGCSSFFYLGDRIEKGHFTEPVRRNSPDIRGKINWSKFIDCHCPLYSTCHELINKVAEEILCQ